MVTVRAARENDRTRAVALLRASHHAAGFDRADGPSGFVVPFRVDYAERLFFAHLVSDACALVLDVAGEAQGLLLAIAHEHPFGPVRLARETVWWIEPGHRGRAAIAMLDVYEAWARGKHCLFAGMAGMGEDPEVGKLYARRGYRAAERYFLKAITA